jgi:hypothetical protein
LVREKLVNRFVKAGQLTIVDAPERADAVLTGAVAADLYGRASVAAFRLTSKDGRIMWVGENSARGLGSYSSKLADHIADGLLKAIEVDSKAK